MVCWPAALAGKAAKHLARARSAPGCATCHLDAAPREVGTAWVAAILSLMCHVIVLMHCVIM